MYENTFSGDRIKSIPGIDLTSELDVPGNADAAAPDDSGSAGNPEKKTSRALENYLCRFMWINNFCR